MNDELPSKPSRLTHFDSIGDDAKKSVANRSLRRAAAINAVLLARSHAGSDGKDITPQESDIVVAIIELLDKVAGAT
jgi:hypothetical protein